MKLIKYDFVRCKILPFFAYWIIKIISSTLRIKYVNREVFEKNISGDKKVLIAFWHQRQFSLVNSHKDFKICLITSLSKDGDIQTAIMQKFGYKCVRGSSSKGGVSALKAAIREVLGGYNMAIAVDGPRGPIYEVKDGILFIAKVCNSIIIPVTSSARKAIVFRKAWDRYILPLPFSSVVIVYGNPIEINKDDDIQEKRYELKMELDRITKIADDKTNFYDKIV